jgi:hypothetical protein
VFLRLKEGHILNMFENKALRRIFEPTRNKVTGAPQFVLFARYYHDDQIKKNYMDVAFSMHREG